MTRGSDAIASAFTTPRALSIAHSSGLPGARSATQRTSATVCTFGIRMPWACSADRFEIGCGGGVSVSVDAHPGGVVDECLGGHRASASFGLERHGILEVEDHRVGAGVEDLAEQFRAVAGGEQIAAVHQMTPLLRSSAMRMVSRPRHSR